MTKNKGFTLIELMVVILIVAILAAVLAPMLTGRISEAKWTEGKTGAGTIATAVRATIAEQRDAASPIDLSAGLTGAGAFSVIGITTEDLNGKYFDESCYALGAVTYNDATGRVTYSISITPPAGSNIRGTYALDQDGTWTYTP